MAEGKHISNKRDMGASDASLRLITEMSPDAVITLSKAGNILFANPAAERLFERPESAMTGTEFGFPIPGEETTEIEVLSKNGALKTAEMRLVDIEWQGEQAVLLSLRDITERKLTEKALGERIKELGCINAISRLANESLLSVEEFVRQAVGILPPGWQYPEACGARISLNSSEFKTTNFRETAWCQAADILVERKQIGSVTICYLEEKPSADEGPFLKEERSLLDTIADFLGHIIQHRLSEEETRASEERFRIIFNSSNDGILLADAKTKKFSFANTAICRLLGYDQDEITNIGVMDIHPEKDLAAALEIFEKQARKEIEVAQALPMKRKDGSVFFADVSAAPVAMSGKPYLLGFFRDVTEQKKLEAQLRHAQKMESIGTLAGGIAHDFNNLLSVIVGYGNMVMDILPTDGLERDDMTMVLSAADKAADLTKRLLLFSRKEVAEMKLVDLNALILDLQKLLTRIVRESIELHLELAGMPLLVLADAGMIEQVLMNLVANARDAMLEGGRLTITTGLKEMDHDFVKKNGYGTAGKYALITVTDTGLGMDIQTQKRAFEPFFTTKEIGKGTGLGLAISYGIIETHKGHIKVNSEPRQGTVFSIYLPLSTEAVTAERQIRAPVAAIKGGHETILLAEDEPAVRQLTARILQPFGYRVIEARNGEEAIARFKEHKESIRLLLLDMIMPKKNGLDVAMAIRKINPDVKVMITSGYTLDIATEKELKGADADFIQKPYLSKELLIKIRKVLER